MNKELMNIIERGTITTEKEFELFVDNADSIDTDICNEIQITDVRIYLSDDKSAFCEIYADEVVENGENVLKNIGKQNIRFYGNGEEYDSFHGLLEII